MQPPFAALGHRGSRRNNPVKSFRQDQAQSTKPDAAAIIQSFFTTGRVDFRFQSFADAKAFVQAWGKGAERWAAAATKDETERRTQVAALAAFEFARKGFDALSPARQSVLQAPLLEAAHARLRQFPPTDFERRWLLATTGFAVGVTTGESAFSRHVRQAAERFPRDSRLRLNGVLLDRDVITLVRAPGISQEDLSFSLGHGDRDQSERNVRNQRAVGRAEPVFEDLLADRDIGAEARARLGWLRFHKDDLTGSLALFSRAVADAREPYLTNLAALGLGLTHLARGRGEDATEAFAAAVAALPSARAATTALAMQLFLSERRIEAAELLDRLSGIPNTLDPWTHVTGGHRLVPVVTDSLRADLGVPPAGVAAVVGALPPETLTPSPSPVPADAPGDRAGATRRADFSTVTSMVSVDVAVSDGRRPVAGLAVGDFELRDNGVVQVIESVAIEGLAIDVTVVLDLRDMGYAVYTDKVVSVMDATRQGVLDTNQLRAQLGPNDRLRVITATRDVNEPYPLQGPGGSARYVVLREIAPAAALHDAMFTALARITPAERRHLILVFTDGVDGASIISSDQLQRVAAQGDALIQVIRRDTVDEFFSREGMSRTSALQRALLRPHRSARVAGGGRGHGRFSGAGAVHRRVGHRRCAAHVGVIPPPVCPPISSNRRSVQRLAQHLRPRDAARSVDRSGTTGLFRRLIGSGEPQWLEQVLMPVVSRPCGVDVVHPCTRRQERRVGEWDVLRGLKAFGQAGPRPVLGSSNQAGLERVALHLSADANQIADRRDFHGSKATLVDRSLADRMAVAIQPARVGRRDPVEAPRERCGVSWTHNQVPVGGHHGVGDEAHGVLLQRFAQNREKGAIIGRLRE